LSFLSSDEEEVEEEEVGENERLPKIEKHESQMLSPLLDNSGRHAAGNSHKFFGGNDKSTVQSEADVVTGLEQKSLQQKLERVLVGSREDLQILRFLKLHKTRIHLADH
jgi:hypothetical protein